jgi:Zn finger protein HypA/HybF involved in hydrogenase expression
MSPGSESPRGNIAGSALLLHCTNCKQDLEPSAKWPPACPICGGSRESLVKNLTVRGGERDRW